ncbi:XRE family transcriptional regulator [Xanthomonas campestris pv. merremiae]|uniref:helix-turn-helix domain-containing protein n=1 Tax=Xanthomonas citri TaxID=346 RepID=UPI000B5CC87F|nr:XRE family transcriptional regulator [Xanthomonas citri]ASK96609.1 XRE family transcriptional regulator [Xanthomonas citri pv. vignicola]MBV6839517.1 XRE family transcriptional regulator [Xanthomonas campestris pv. merremiae]MBZ3933364.1 XRE family transcriptional regulator [Xanthomonas campestris pv. merremiae]MCC8564623.1 XRE family transcriptional regulator [Xanthomonas citri pv. fuscans]
MESPFNPSRLIAARQRAKFSKKDLATRIDVTQKSISLYEDGRQPSPATLAKLARALGVPPGFFFAPDLSVPTPENASFRSFSRMTSAQRDSALASGGYAFAFASWMEARYHLPVMGVPDLSGADPEVAAALVRSEWGLGVLPIKNMVHLLESRGVRVFSLVEDSREVNAFSSWRHGQTPFVFLNTVKSSESSRFDAAHELGHLVLHRHGEAKGKQVEAEANAFAAALLMPKSEMLALAGRCRSVKDVLSLKKRWNVSAMALVYRLHKVGVLTEWLYKSLCIELSTLGMRTNEADSAERETSLVLKKVFDAMKEQGQGLRDIATDLQLPVEEVHRLVFGLTTVALGFLNPQARTSAPRRGHLRLVG